MTAGGKDHLTALPPELLTNIIKGSPLRELCLLRTQNHKMRDFIDFNQGALVADIIEHHRARMIREYSSLTIFPDKGDCFDAMASYVRYYGDIGNDESESKNTAIIYTALRKMGAQPLSRASGEPVAMFLRLAKTPGIFNATPLPLPQTLGVSYKAFMLYHLSTLMDGLILQFVHLSLDAYNLLINGANFRARLARLFAIHQSDATYGNFPNHFLSTRGHFSLPWRTVFTSEALCDAQHIASLQRRLRLPDLGDDGSLAYCSTSVGAAGLVKELSGGRATLAALKEAALLEDLYIW